MLRMIPLQKYDLQSMTALSQRSQALLEELDRVTLSGGNNTELLEQMASLQQLIQPIIFHPDNLSTARELMIYSQLSRQYAAFCQAFTEHVSCVPYDVPCDTQPFDADKIIPSAHQCLLLAHSLRALHLAAEKLEQYKGERDAEYYYEMLHTYKACFLYQARLLFNGRDAVDHVAYSLEIFKQFLAVDAAYHGIFSQRIDKTNYDQCPLRQIVVNNLGAFFWKSISNTTVSDSQRDVICKHFNVLHADRLFHTFIATHQLTSMPFAWSRRTSRHGLAARERGRFNAESACQDSLKKLRQIQDAHVSWRADRFHFNDTPEETRHFQKDIDCLRKLLNGIRQIDGYAEEKNAGLYLLYSDIAELYARHAMLLSAESVHPYAKSACEHYVLAMHHSGMPDGAFSALLGMASLEVDFFEMVSIDPRREAVDFARSLIYLKQAISLMIIFSNYRINTGQRIAHDSKKEPLSALWGRVLTLLTRYPSWYGLDDCSGLVECLDSILISDVITQLKMLHPEVQRLVETLVCQINKVRSDLTNPSLATQVDNGEPALASLPESPAHLAGLQKKKKRKKKRQGRQQPKILPISSTTQLTSEPPASKLLVAFTQEDFLKITHGDYKTSAALLTELQALQGRTHEIQSALRADKDALPLDVCRGHFLLEKCMAMLKIRLLAFPGVAEVNCLEEIDRHLSSCIDILDGAEDYPERDFAYAEISTMHAQFVVRNPGAAFLAPPIQVAHFKQAVIRLTQLLISRRNGEVCLEIVALKNALQDLAAQYLAHAPHNTDVRKELSKFVEEIKRGTCDCFPELRQQLLVHEEATAPSLVREERPLVHKRRKRGKKKKKTNGRTRSGNPAAPCDGSSASGASIAVSDQHSVPELVRTGFHEASEADADRPDGLSILDEHIPPASRMPIPKALRDDWYLRMAVNLIERIQTLGYKVCLTGGAARRLVRTQVGVPKDLDIITNAPPERLQEICPGYSMLPLRISGVSGVLRGKECDGAGKQIDCDIVCKPCLDLMQLMSISPSDHDCKFFVFLNDANELTLFAPSGRDAYEYYQQEKPRLRRNMDPDVVYQENPLLILKELRLLKEDATGDLRLSEQDERWIRGHPDTICKVYPQRIHVEMEKYFLFGAARRNLENLCDFGLLKSLISVITGQPADDDNTHTPQGLGWQLLCDCCDAFDMAVRMDEAKGEYSSAHIYAMLLAYIHLQQTGSAAILTKGEATARVAKLFSGKLPILLNPHATDAIATIFCGYCQKYKPQSHGYVPNPYGYWSTPEVQGAPSTADDNLTPGMPIE